MSRPHTDVLDTTRRNDAHALLVCPACGTPARRDDARFCATCGRCLGERAYLPADTLRASYHLQQRQPALIRPHAPHRSCILRKRMPTAMGWSPKSNHATQRALAFLNYALVPYLGLLFCPGAIIYGVVGLWRARYAPHHHGSARIAGRCILLGLVISGAQVFLWWILYNVSPWARP
jgi:hypothetical protein